MVLRHVRDTPRLDPEFALRLVGATMRVLSARISSLLAATAIDADVNERVRALSAALRTLRSAQQRAIDIASDKRASRSLSSTQRNTTHDHDTLDDVDNRSTNDNVPSLDNDNINNNSIHRTSLSARWTPVVSSTRSANTMSISQRVVTARSRRPATSAWRNVVSDVCRSVYDAIEGFYLCLFVIIFIILFICLFVWFNKNK